VVGEDAMGKTYVVGDGNLSAIRCKMCTKIKTQAKIINPKVCWEKEE
jgi:hypothetical protein